jgi:hypothetical protein
MATLPQFKQRQIARRSSSDIDRLAKQYKTSVDQLTGEYQTAFTGYQAGVAEKMKPYEAQMATYKESLLPTYESQQALYKQKLDDYNKVLADIEKNPTIEVPYVYSGGKKIIKVIGPPPTQFVPKPIPKFTETAPVAPDIPVSPTVEPFDSTQFEAKKGVAEGEFKREVGERRAAKLGAVSRKGARPLLSGAQA